MARMLLALLGLALPAASASADPFGLAVGATSGTDTTNPWTTSLTARGPTVEAWSLPSAALRVRVALAGGFIDGAETGGVFWRAVAGLDGRRCWQRGWLGVGVEIGEAHYRYEVDVVRPAFFALTGAASLFGELRVPDGFIGLRLLVRGKRIHGEEGANHPVQAGAFAEAYLGFDL
jgi:hypothetical protein